MLLTLKRMGLLALVVGAIFSCQKENPNKVEDDPITTTRLVEETPPCESAEQSDLRILFIGNSFTDNYSVKIPEMFSQLVETNGKSVSLIKSRCVNGWTLADHLASGTTQSIINQGDWDYVILQENSGLLNSLANPELLLQVSIDNMADFIATNSPAAKLILYQVVPPVDENTAVYEEKMELWNTAFSNVANSHYNAYRCNIGQAFTTAYGGEYGYNSSPDYLRYEAIYQHHFRNSGGFLAAVTFYSAIFNSKPCIPLEMNFYQGAGEFANSPVEDAVPQFHELAQIGFEEGVSDVHIWCLLAASDYYGVGLYPCAVGLE